VRSRLAQWAWLAAPLSVLAQPTPPAEALATSVYTLDEHHTSRRTEAKDPLEPISGVCRIAGSEGSWSLECSGPPGRAARTGREHHYTVALFLDLDRTLYLAACSDPNPDSRCQGVKAGVAFPSEVEDRTLRLGVGSEQILLRILETRRRPATIDSPARGTPSQTRPSTGAPSLIPYSGVEDSRGTSSQVTASQVSQSAGAPSDTPPSKPSIAVAPPTGGRLSLYCANVSANVYIDKQWMGHPPLEAPLPPGRHTVVVRARGYRGWSRSVDIPAGATVRLRAELQR